ncbi:MAG: hypothetical protein ABIF01_05795 [Candidatus Micrarchaeota archaeon]
MKIVPLAFDSMGARSMATYVETKDLKLVIDPAVSLAPNRFGLMPHPKEKKRMSEQWGEIKKRARASDALVITHYHLDHYNPDEPGIYRGKQVFLKNPDVNINDSQAARSRGFIPKIEKISKGIEFADGTEHSFGNTALKFSPPVFHGIDSKLGYVVEVFVDDGKERFLHTSDVEGPALDEQIAFILRANPTVVFLDGPLSYMLYKFGERALERSLHNMLLIIDRTDVKKLVVDHHFLRDSEYRERISKVVKFGKEEGCKVITAAEFAGKKVEPLETMRKALYEKKG